MINRSQLGKTTMLKRPKPQAPRKIPGGRKMPKPKGPRTPPRGKLQPRPKFPKPKGPRTPPGGKLQPRPKFPKRKLPALPKRKLTPEELKRLKKILPDRARKLSPEMMKKFKKLMPARKTMKKGGFPDLSGDGKVTKKDILMGRGVIKKKLGGPVSMIAKKAGKTIGMGRGGRNLIKKKKPNRKK